MSWCIASKRARSLLRNKMIESNGMHPSSLSLSLSWDAAHGIIHSVQFGCTSSYILTIRDQACKVMLTTKNGHSILKYKITAMSTASKAWHTRSRTQLNCKLKTGAYHVNKIDCHGCRRKNLPIIALLPCEQAKPQLQGSNDFAKLMLCAVTERVCSVL